MEFVEIDLEQYPRRKHLEYFSSLQYPYVGVTSNIDVTDLVQFCKNKGYSLYLVLLHIATLAADGVPQLRQRIHGKTVREYACCPSSHTELLEDGTYCYCTLHHHMELEDYLAYAQATRLQCRAQGSIDEEEDVESMYFISSLPWLHYSALIQPVAGGNESNPRITWGQYQPDHTGRLQLPVTLLAHHGLVDGIHIARFYQNFESEIRNIIG